MSYIVIEGNIGSGKTSLSKRLADYFNASLIHEEFEDNPFLELFYKEPEKYAFPLEYSFLLDRVRQLHKINFSSKNLFFSDYILQKCLWFARINLNKVDFENFKVNFYSITDTFPSPDFVFFLHLPLDKLRHNIKSRNRAIEHTIDSDYLRKISEMYHTRPEFTPNTSQKVFDIHLSDNHEAKYTQLFDFCVDQIQKEPKTHEVGIKIQI